MSQNSIPLVSIVIVNWNGIEHLKECLPALMDQDYKDYEIIVVDNGSKDESCDFINAKFPFVQLISLNENMGFDKANIIGFENSRGDYIVLLNNDTRPRKNWLGELAKAVLTDTKIGIVGSVMLRWNSSIIDTAGDGCTWAGVGFKMYSGYQYSELPDKINAFGACAGAALYTRRMIEDIGFLDESFFMNLEDVDLSYRARLSGYKVIISNESVVEHRVSASVSKLSALNTYYASRNIELVWWKNTPSRYILLSIPDKILHTFVAFVIALKSPQRLKNFIRGKKDAYVMIVRGDVNRKKIQNKYNQEDISLTCELKRMLVKAGIIHV